METQKSLFQFTNPQLEELTFFDNEEFFSGEATIDLATSLKTSVENYNNQPSRVSIELTVGEKTNRQPFYIYVRMSALFKWDDELSHKDVVSMLSTAAPSLLISYARPIIANVTGWSRQTQFNLPFLNLTQNELEMPDDECEK